MWYSSEEFKTMYSSKFFRMVIMQFAHIIKPIIY